MAGSRERKKRVWVGVLEEERDPEVKNWECRKSSELNYRVFVPRGWLLGNRT